MTKYGAPPIEVGVYDLDFTEYMHYMYLPIFIAGDPSAPKIPKNLQFAWAMIYDAMIREYRERGLNFWDYVYVTARRGFATPGNPLNRPGLHADGFGTNDVNYVWTDRYPTNFFVQEFTDISDDHIVSIEQFNEQVDFRSTVNYPDKTLLRLDQSVIHAAPTIPAPGGERSFFKISFSNSKYNLLGNSHNYDLDYDWHMFSRDEVRNDPSRSGGDSA